MSYEQIKISNFRGIKNLHLTGLKRINLLLGNNNSGKTSVLESIFLTTGVSNPQLAVSVDNFRNLVHTEGDDFKFIFNGLDYNNEPNFEAFILGTGVERTLNIRPVLKQAIDVKDRASNVTSSSSSKGSLVAEGLIFDFTIKARHQPRINQKSTIMFERNGNISVTPPKNYKETLSAIFVTNNTSFVGADLSKRFERIIINKQKNEVLEILKIIDPEIRDIELGVQNMIYLDVGLNTYIPFNLEGSGLQRLLYIITSIYYSRNGIVLIDELENGLHYKSYIPVWTSLIRAAITFNVQLFISTHNYEILEALSESVNLNQLDLLKDELRMYALQKRDREIMAFGYSYDQFENSVNKDIEVR